MNDRSSAQVLESAKYVSLITFRKSGEPVRSPVWFARFGDESNSYGVITETNAGKVKRVRANSKIEVQVCDAKGLVASDAPRFSGTARLVIGEQAVAVRKAIAKQYGVTYKLFSFYLVVSSLFKKKDGLPETNIIFELEN